MFDLGNTLYSFSFQRLSPMLDKGNVWYVRHYESYFGKVELLYLLGAKPRELAQGRTRLVSLGSRWRWLDFLLAPWRLLRHVRTQGPGLLLTADQVFGWWITLLVRLAGHPVVLMPVCFPEDIYRDTGKSLSGLPIFIERLLINLSFASAHTVLTGRSFGAFADRFSVDPRAKNKLLLVDVLPDALPSPDFLNNLSSARTDRGHCQGKPKTLVYVGRLHREKLVEDLVHMMRLLAEDGVGTGHVRLQLIGDGPDRQALSDLARALGVEECVDFVGSVPNAEIPALLTQADVFVSPLTGTSLREAAMCGLPIVAYDRDWIKGLLRHEETALLAPSRDIASLAREVRRLLDDPALADSLSAASRQLAERLWSAEKIPASMAELQSRLVQ